MKRLPHYLCVLGLAGVMTSAMLAAVVSPQTDRALELYKRTEYEAALRLLSSFPAKDAAVYMLMGQCYYMEGEPKKASEQFQKAVELQPGDSNSYMWLGRALGRRAETSSFVTAPGYATKARDAFEKAVQLNPRNAEAISDLFEYYLDAPGFLGGGYDKALALANRMQKLNPAEGAWAQARLAEKRKELSVAEEQLRRAADLAPRQVGRVIDLAKFLAKSGRYQESEEAFHRAETIDPSSPKLLFEHASMYIRSGKNLDVARKLLKQYIDASLTPDDPPRREAQALLKQASSS